MRLGFNSSNIDRLLASIIGTELDPTVSLCHQCHRHIPAWRYHKDNQVFIAKACPVHGVSHHMIEADYEFYANLYYTQIIQSLILMVEYLLKEATVVT